MQYFIQQLINGLTLGTAYGLIAVGYTLVYSILRLVNFAHGEVYMAGCYAALFAVNALIAADAPDFLILLLSLIAGMTVAGLLGVLIERLAYRRVRQVSIPATMITSLGMSIFLQNVAFVAFGASPTNFPNRFPRGSIFVFGISMTVGAGGKLELVTRPGFQVTTLFGTLPGLAVAVPPPGQVERGAGLGAGHQAIGRLKIVVEQPGVVARFERVDRAFEDALVGEGLRHRV